MAYIGNTVVNQGFSPAVDYFNGDGTTVTFTLSRPVASVAQLTAVIENVIQNPSSAFTVAGNAITFTSAPPAGTNNIWVEYTSLVTTYAAISQDPTVIGDITATGGYLSTGDFGNSYVDGTIVDYVTGNSRITTGPIDDMTFYHGGTASRSELMKLYYAGGAKIYGTTALTIPVGTTAQRPGTPAAGMIRMNSTTSVVEVYNGSVWLEVSTLPNYTYAIDYLVVGGGGSGAEGGGGAGGFLAKSDYMLSGTAYAVTVGAGGAGAIWANAFGSGGSNSSLVTASGTQTAIGGGAGGCTNNAGGQGGSGGGGRRDGNAQAGAGYFGQGMAGGVTMNNTPGYEGGSGGGGAGGAGNPGGNYAMASPVASAEYGGAGGGGLYWYNGVAYAGGGGGGVEAPGGTSGTAQGGIGGGGQGNKSNSVAPTSGTTNTGGGGGGIGSATGFTSGSGGSGIVIIRYAGSQRGTGGTVTSSGGYTYHTFTSSGTYTA